MEKQIFNINAALDLLDNDRDLLKILMNSFLTEMPFDTEKLNEFIKSRKFEEGAKYVHAVKGAGRQLCAELLAQAGQELEDVLRNKKQGDIPTLIKKMSIEYEKAFSQIKDKFNSI